ncbi:MAG: sulfurtransferase TusA family protein [Gammaproteobacteria bacterium]|nr:sulfurtransferase TusA family protein [Gammaproteobacteria bacterium]
MEQAINQEVDARGLNCPLPILRIKKALNTLQTGEVVRMRATDPGSVKDIVAFCNQTGTELLSSEEGEGEFVFTMKKN